MIDINKKYKTKDGRDVRIYAVDGGGAYCVHGAILLDRGWGNAKWLADGHYSTSDCTPEFDLIEQTTTQTYYRRKWVKYGDTALDTNTLWYTTKEGFDRDYSYVSSRSEEWEEMEI